ncbi:HipA family kinase, partial [Stenotrophomonas pictorum]
WMAGHLAVSFGLNLPDFAIAIAPSALVRLHPEGKDLGTSPVFASKAIEQLSWLNYASKELIPLQVRRDIAVFDWWVHNADRTLTGNGGNPNLLFDTSTSELIVIDHNLAFDPDFNEEAFLSTHVFSDEWRGLCQDLMEMANYRTRLNQALAAWDQAWQQVPDEWLFHDDEQSIPVNFDAVACKTLLERCDHQDFWRMA